MLRECRVKWFFSIKLIDRQANALIYCPKLISESQLSAANCQYCRHSISLFEFLNARPIITRVIQLGIPRTIKWTNPSLLLRYLILFINALLLSWRFLQLSRIYCILYNALAHAGTRIGHARRDFDVELGGEGRRTSSSLPSLFIRTRITRVWYLYLKSVYFLGGHTTDTLTPFTPHQQFVLLLRCKGSDFHPLRIQRRTNVIRIDNTYV